MEDIIYSESNVKEFIINVDIYNADIRTLTSNNEFQVKILLNTLNDTMPLESDFARPSFQDSKSGLFHLDWYQNVNTKIKTTLKPLYMADIIIQLIEKETLSVVAYTRLNFNDMLINKQKLTSFELINLQSSRYSCISDMDFANSC